MVIFHSYVKLPEGRSFAQFLRRGRWHILDILVTSKVLWSKIFRRWSPWPGILYYTGLPPQEELGRRWNLTARRHRVGIIMVRGVELPQVALFQAGTCLQTQPDMCFLAWTFSAYWPLCICSLSINQWLTGGDPTMGRILVSKKLVT